MEKEVEWNTGHSNAKFNSSVYVAFDLLTDKVLSAKVFNGGTGSKYNTSANTVAAQFVGLDATTVAGMTTSSHEGVDFVANSTVSSTNAFNLVVEAAIQYANDKTLTFLYIKYIPMPAKIMNVYKRMLILLTFTSAVIIFLISS